MGIRFTNMMTVAALVLVSAGCTGTIYPPGSCGDILTAPGNAYPLFDWRLIRGGTLPQSYAYGLDDGDGIQIDVADGAAQGVQSNEVLIVLAAGPRVTWYKAVVAWNKYTGELPQKVEVVDGSAPDTMKLTRSSCNSGRSTGADTIFFSKAKRLGVHSNMYHLDTNQFWNLYGGKVLTFTWVRDDAPSFTYTGSCTAGDNTCIPLTPGS